MLELYQNKKWLKNKYLKEKLSSMQIGKICNRDHKNILYWLYKFNIPTRSLAESTHLAEANHCNLSQEAIEWINGELLGDGCLSSQSKYSAKFVYASKYYKYIRYVSDVLVSFGIKQTGRITEQYNKSWNCYTYQYASCNYVELLPIRKHWYPNGKKIVPRDINLTPLACRQFYIGEGCLAHPKRGNHNSHIILCTYGFTIEDVEWLVFQLNKINFRATRRPCDNSIRISTDSTKAFLNYIGECPVDCYKYKWDYEKWVIK